MWPTMRQANALYQRNDAGVLTLASLGVAGADASGGRSGSWGDYDDDGDLDLYVANYSGTSKFRTCCIATTAVTRLWTCRLGRAWPRTSPSFSASWVDYDLRTACWTWYAANSFGLWV